MAQHKLQDLELCPGAQQFSSGKGHSMRKFLWNFAKGTTGKPQGTTGKPQGTTGKPQGTTAIHAGAVGYFDACTTVSNGWSTTCSKIVQRGGGLKTVIIIFFLKLFFI